MRIAGLPSERDGKLLLRQEVRIKIRASVPCVAGKEELRFQPKGYDVTKVG